MGAVPTIKRFFQPAVDKIFGNPVFGPDGVESDSQLGLAFELQRVGVHTVGKFFALGGEGILARGFGNQAFLNEPVDVESEVVVGDVNGFEIPKSGIGLE